MRFPTKTSRARVAGFTLAEILTASGLLGLLIIAIVTTQLFAARVYTFAATKLTSTASGRKIMNDLRDRIRSCSDARVCNYNAANNTFSYNTPGTNMIGNALAIWPWNDTNNGTIYFMNKAASNICSVNISNGVVETSTRVDRIVVYITNYFVFDEEDSFTNILTSYVNDRVIHVKLLFAEWEYPFASVGNGAMYDYYQLQTRVSKRLTDY